MSEEEQAPQQQALARDLPPPIGKPSWKVRRRVVITTLVFCASMVVYLAGWGPDDELRNTIANGVIFLAGSVIMSYIFGVVWNDKSVYASAPKEDPYEYGSYGGMGYRGRTIDGEG